MIQKSGNIMRNNKKAFFILAGICCTLVGNAQILSPDRIRGRIMHRAENRAAQEVDNRVDREVDKVLNGIFGSLDKEAPAAETKQNREEDALSALNKTLSGMSQTTAPNISYDFTSSYTMRMTTTEKGKTSQPMSLTYFFSSNGNYFGSEIMNAETASEENLQNQFIVFDLDKKAMYTFMDANNQKNMISIGLSGLENLAEETIETTQYTRTGKTKTIAGYACEGYLTKQDQQEYLVWISKGSVPVMSSHYKNFNKVIGANQKGMLFNYSANADMERMMQQGQVVMGMEYEEKGSKTEMEVVKIKPNESYSFQTGEYNNMLDLNKMMQESKKEK
jgi:hypothetical protein